VDAGASTAADLDSAASTLAFVEYDACANSLTRAVGDLRVCIRASPCSICSGPPHCSMGVAAAKQLAPICNKNARCRDIPEDSSIVFANSKVNIRYRET